MVLTTLSMHLGQLPAPAPLVLYVDCWPMKGSGIVVTSLDEYVRPFMAEAAEANGVPHYSLVEYGRGPSYVAARVLESPPQGAVYVNTRFPSSAACLEVLQPLAVAIVKGH